MSRILSQEKIVGFALDATQLYRAQIACTASRVRIEALDTVPLNEAVDEHRDNTQSTNGKSIVSAVFPCSKTLVRHLSLSLVKPKDIEATVLFEAEPLLPFPVEKCLVDKIRLHATKTSTELQLFAALKEDIQEFLDLLASQEIDPEILCPKPEALSHFAALLRPDEAFQLIIDCDHLETCCLLVHNGKPLLCRSHPEGLEKLQVTDEEDLSSIHLFLREIARIFLHFQQNSSLDPETFQSIALLCTGPLAEKPELIELLTDFLGHTAALPGPIGFQIENSSHAYSWTTLCTFAAPIGSALAHKHLQKELSSINFRKEEFAYADRWRRWKKELLTYFCLMLSIAAIAFITGQRFLEQQHMKLVETYAKLLMACEKPVDEKALLSLSKEDLASKLYDLEKEISSTTDAMPLHPDVPRVSDLLAWLSSHPQVAGNDKSLRLESLNYTMTKRPEKGKVKERYQVRVDLEFSAPNATMAREFHDALLSPNPFVDPKSELKWSAQKGRFRASFFLKDRTQYPQTAVQGVSVHAGN